MNLQEIRTKLVENQNYLPNMRKNYAHWLAFGKQTDFQFGLTLMPKKVPYKRVPKSRYAPDGVVLRHLNKAELLKAAEKFIHILNTQLYKQAYRRNNKCIDSVMTIEGDNEGCVDLHAHFALTKPSYMGIKMFVKEVHRALQVSNEFEIFNPNYDAGKCSLDEKYRYKLDLINEEWAFYITKKLDRHTAENLYLI